jgi:LmeA-like phospholipid-binding
VRAALSSKRGLTILALVAGALVVALLVLAQLLGPRIAARQVRKRVGAYGSVKSVKVKVWPAVKLLWGDADEIDVHAGSLKMSPTQTVSLLRQATGVETVHARADTLREGSLQLTDARFEKHGTKLRAEATMSAEAVNSALPAGISVSLLHSEGGTVTVRVSGGLFGLGASVEAVAKASEGKLIAQPTSVFLQAFHLTLFSNPKVYVEGVEAQPVWGSSGSKESPGSAGSVGSDGSEGSASPGGPEGSEDGEGVAEAGPSAYRLSMWGRLT